MSTAIDQYTELGFVGPRPKPPTPEELAEQDAQREQMRQRNRHHIKREIAKRKQVASRVSEYDASIQVPESRIDTLAAEHQNKCAPWQLELKQLESASIDRVMEGLEPSEGIETRKRELREAIEAANRELETALQAERETLERLKKERWELATTLKDFPTNTDLLNTARPDLSDALKVATNGVQWANARLNAAKDKASKFRATSWLHLEITAATKALADAKEAEQAAMAEIINE